MTRDAAASPTWGTRLKRARKAAGYSNAHKLLAAMVAEDGKAPSYSTYAQWESGEVQPREENIAPVVAFHERHGTWDGRDAAPDLATALMALADELRESRLARDAMAEQLEALTRAASVMAERLAALESAASAGLPVPRG